MRIIFKYLILCCFVLSVVVSSGQPAGLYDSKLNQSSNNLYGKIIGEVYYLPPGANSNYFLHKEWVNGTVVFRTGEVFDNIKLRYNAFKDELIAFNENDRLLVLIDKEKVKEFTLDFSKSETKIADITFVNIDSVSLLVNTNYFECLYRGNVMLLISNRITELKVSPYNDSSGKLRDTEFVQRKANFIYSPEIGLIKVRLSNRSIAKAFPEKKHEILKLIRKSKIRISDAETATLAFQTLDKDGLLN